MEYDYNAEKNEAIQAGERALESLKNALEALDSARGWGIYDILGGGFFSTMFKHSKMDKASGYIEQAKSDIRKFSRELKDVREYADVNLSTEDFWGFADFFMDGFIADWIMQNRINEARMQVQEAIRRVESVLDSLKK